jgi:phosphoribosyl 1,2-cyclic phosphodiesterase
VEASGLEMDDIDAILISHEHIDHVRGIEVLSRRYGKMVYATEDTWENMKKFPEHRGMLRREMSFGDITVRTFPVPHDAVDPVGFEVMHRDVKLVAVTDIGHAPPYLLQTMSDADVVIIESNHDVEMLKANPKYPPYLKSRILGRDGHLSNEDCASALESSLNPDAVAVMLAHLSEENNRPELARSVAETSTNAPVIVTGLEPTEIVEL